jgi:predicted nucleotidyltransferase
LKFAAAYDKIFKMDLKSYLEEIKAVLSEAEGIGYAYLFGSALKQLLPESDVDILVGGDLDFEQKTALALKLSLRLKRNVDLVLAKEASYELILTAISQGLPVFVREKGSLRRAYFQSYFLYDANTSLRNIRLQRVKRIFAA